MDFEKNVPKWENNGTEPPEDLKANGWKAGYKPPADYFNWFWNRVSACLTEIRTKLKGHAEATGNPHNTTAADVGAAEAAHEHLYARGVTTAGNGAAYRATVEGITALEVGVSFILIPHIQSSTTAPTLDVNNLGAKTIRRRISNSTASTNIGSAASWLTYNKPVRVTYDGTYWIVDMDQPNANDLYGTLPITKGGTGATTLEAAQANLQIAPATEHNEHPGCYYRTGGSLDDYIWMNPPLTSKNVYKTTEQCMGSTVYAVELYLSGLNAGKSNSFTLTDAASGAAINALASARVVSVSGAVMYADTNGVSALPDSVEFTLYGTNGLSAKNSGTRDISMCYALIKYVNITIG